MLRLRKTQGRVEVRISQEVRQITRYAEPDIRSNDLNEDVTTQVHVLVP